MKNRLITLAAVAALISMTSLSAEEGKPKHEKGKGPMAAMDKDGDGFVSKEEFMASPKAQEDAAKAAEKFAKLDTNTDGKISADEFKAGAPKGKKGEGNKEKKPE